MSNDRILKRRMAAAAAAALVLAGAGTAAQGAVPSTQGTAEAQYAHDRANCLAGRRNEDLKSCLRESGASLQAARHHDLSSPSPRQLAANARRRCDPLSGDDKRACLARVEGEGTASGSVAGGGILYEYHEIIPGTAPDAHALPDAASPPSGS